VLAHHDRYPKKVTESMKINIDSGLGRDLYIRGGMTTIIAAIAYFILGIDAWIWLLPVGVTALVLVKWLLHPQVDDEPDDDDKE
jgi:hypothetical protein